MAVGVLLLAPLSAYAARRVGWSAHRILAAAAAGMGVALVLATTLGRYRDGLMFGLGRSCLRTSVGLGTPEQQLNLALFAPATFFAVVATRRLRLVLVSALLLSLGVEGIQLVTDLGACQTSDVALNLAGAVAVAVPARLLVAVALRRTQEPSRQTATTRR
ncbi:hypothetical protein NLS1_16720 [Nocardioides sp. LS1]|nr:hypothetical protein NLS1_16720 [Nocardioides sp. LS1]